MVEFVFCVLLFLFILSLFQAIFSSFFLFFSDTLHAVSISEVQVDISMVFEAF